jgi:hypothetical protein
MATIKAESNPANLMISMRPDGGDSTIINAKPTAAQRQVWKLMKETVYKYTLRTVCMLISPPARSRADC